MSGTVIKALHESTGDSYFQDILNEILEKLRDDPSSITTEDARRLSENAVADDLRTAKIISAVEAFAAASEFDHEVNPQMDNAPHTSLLTVVNDLRVTVDRNPTNVTTEILRSAQAVVSKMQRAVGHTDAPYPELEAELQGEIARIEPKVVEGTVTVEEANHLHFLEARTHGHTEKGGATSIAQSVATKHEYQLSLRSGSAPIPSRSCANSKTCWSEEQFNANNEANLHADNVVKPKSDQGPSIAVNPLIPTKHQESLSDQTNVSAQVCKNHSQHDHEMDLKLAEKSLQPKLKHESETASQ